MPRAQSALAIQTLESLASRPDQAVTLSFSDEVGLRTAEWATGLFAGQLLIDRVRSEYNRNPELDKESGEPIPLDDLSGHRGADLMDAQADAQEIGHEVNQDLKMAVKRVKRRGYDLGQVSVHGTVDTTVIVGSLERAIEVDPDNLDESGQYFQASAQYMLEHMQVIRPDIGDATSYIL
jgi:hypothetical protein